MKTASIFAQRARQTWRMAGVLAILCVLAAAASAHEAEENAQPQRITVPDDVPELLAAYEKIADGGTIVLKPGHYKIAKQLEITKNVHIVGESEDPAKTTIEYARHGAAVIIQAKCGSLQRLSLRGVGMQWCLYEPSDPSDFVNGGYIINGRHTNPNTKFQKPRESCVLLISAGEFEVVECDVQTSRCGVIVEGNGTNPVFRGCKFHGGEIGVFLYREGKAVFEDCEFTGYTSRGLEVPFGCRAELLRCRISGGEGTGAELYGVTVFTECTVRNTSRKRPGILICGPLSETRFIHCDLCTESKPPVVCRTNRERKMFKRLTVFKSCKIYRDPREVEGENISFWTYGMIPRGELLNILGPLEMEDCEVFNGVMGLWAQTNSYRSNMETFPTVTLRKCKFHGHSDTGVRLDQFIDAVADDCEFYDNVEYAIHSIAAEMKMKKCKFYKNGHGAALVDSPHDVRKSTVSDSEFYENRKTALSCGGDGCEVRDCSFRKNGTGLSFSSRKGVVEDCEMRDGTVGVAMQWGLMKGCKIVSNKIGVRGYSGTLDTCAMTDNTDAGVDMYDYSSMTLKNSHIRGSKIGADLADDAQLSLEGCEISDCEIGVQLHDLSSMTGEKVKIHQCRQQELLIKTSSSLGVTLTDSTLGEQRWTGTRMFSEEEEADE